MMISKKATECPSYHKFTFPILILIISFFFFLSFSFLFAKPSFASVSSYLSILNRPYQAKPDWVKNPASKYSLESTRGVLRFKISEPQKAMKWLCLFPENQLIHPYITPFLALEYRANNLSPASQEYLICAVTQKGSKVLLLHHQIFIDGEWHKVVFDLPRLGVNTFIKGLLIQIQSSNFEPQFFENYEIGNLEFITSEAQLEIKRLIFLPSPPESFSFFPKLKTEEVWIDDFDTLNWIEKPEWLGNASEDSYITPTLQGTKFVCNGVSRGMKWSKNFDQEIDLSSYCNLAIRYRAAGIKPFPDYFLHFSSLEGKSAIPLRLNELNDDGRWHLKVVPLKIFFKTNVLNVHLQTDAPSAYVEIDFIQLLPYKKRFPFDEVIDYQIGWPSNLGSYSPVPLPNWRDGRAEVFLDNLNGWFNSQTIQVNNIPFRVGSPKHLPHTSLLEKGKAIVPLTFSGSVSEFYLLLAARLPEYEVPFSVMNTAKMGYGLLSSVETFYIEIEYEDKQKDKVFPYHIPSLEPKISDGLELYLLPVPQTKKVKALRFKDNLRTGGFAIVGLTANRGKRNFSLDKNTNKIPTLPKIKPRRKKPLPLPPDNLVSYQSNSFLLALNPNNAQPLLLGSTYISLRNSSYDPIFQVLNEAKEPIGLPELIQYQKDKTLNIEYLFKEKEIKATLTIDKNEDELILKLKLKNLSPSGLKLRLLFPVFKNCSIADPVDDYYFDSARITYISQKPVKLSTPYGGSHPLQFMGLFDSTGSFYLRILDVKTIYKIFNLSKRTSGGTDFSVEYPYIYLSSGETYELPPVALATTNGDWKDTFQKNKVWLQRVARPVTFRKSWFRKIFHFHQHRFNEGFFKNGRFYPNFLINEDKTTFGSAQIFHFIDWSESKNYGRVGDYGHYEERGGLGAFQKIIQYLRKLGVRVGLYFEGRLVDSRSEAGSQNLENWVQKNKNGEMMRWPNAPTEFFVCPNSISWRNYLKKTIRRVAAETGADAFYIDQFGFGDTLCYNDWHGHIIPYPTLTGEIAFLKELREITPPYLALYTEEAPSDIATAYLDGSFTYALWNWNESLSPIPLSLLRFSAPSFKTFQIISYLPASEKRFLTLAKFALFNGEGLWLQGRAKSYSRVTKQELKRIFSVMNNHADAFGGDIASPLVDTMVNGVSANLFASKNKRVYTLYNSLYRTLRANVLEIPHVNGATYLDAWNGKILTPKIIGGKAIINLELNPRDIGCVVQILSPPAPLKGKRP